MEYILYLLIFIFGYFTCKAVYFLRSLTTSMALIRLAQLVALSIFAKTLEDIHYARVAKMEGMLKNKESQHNVQAFVYRFEDEMASYKRRCIKGLIDLHPQIFHETIQFDDWKSAMKFLNDHQSTVEHILRGEPTND
tara:strand:+ start:407 stop:817 length:411 start_codon:yes stop_codon:yes gene_type:complete